MIWTTVDTFQKAGLHIGIELSISTEMRGGRTLATAERLRAKDGVQIYKRLLENFWNRSLCSFTVNESLNNQPVQVGPHLTQHPEVVEPVQAQAAAIANLVAGDVSSILDGVRDATAGLQEAIESSQATIGAYHNVILEEKAGVRIMTNISTPDDEPSSNKIKRRNRARSPARIHNMAPAISPSPSILSIHSTASEKACGKRPEAPYRDHSYSAGEGSAASYAPAVNTSDGGMDSEGTDEGSTSEAEGDGSSDESVSSGGLTNTTEDSDE